MPRIEFNTEAEIRAWYQAMTTPAKYVVYTTMTHEIIFEPRTSTSPVRFGYFASATTEVFQKLIAELREANYAVFACANYIWASDRIVGAAGGKR